MQSQTKYWYDNDVSHGIAPTDGLLVREQVKLTSSQFANSYIDYDTAGRPESVTDAENNVTQTEYWGWVAPDGFGYPKKTIDATPAANTSWTYFDEYRRLERTKDVDGRDTTLSYTIFSELSSVTRHGETNPAVIYSYSYPTTANPVRVTTKSLYDDAGSGSYVTTHSFVDGFGRSIQTQALSPVTGSPRITFTGTHYDAQGRPDAQSAPIGSTQTFGNYRPTNIPNLSHTDTTYDGLGRVTRTALNNDNDYQTIYTYTGRTTTTTQTIVDTSGTGFQVPGTANTVFLVDAFGQLKQMTNDASDSTDYQYDLLGNLVEIQFDTDPATTIGDDLASRKTSIDDPSMGDWSYTYDKTGNLKTQTDGNGVTRTFIYDELSRLVEEKQGATVLAMWDYGVAGHAYALAESQAYPGHAADEVTTAYVSYDTQGRLLRKETTNGAGTFAQAWTYDADGRVASYRFPGGNTNTLGEIVDYEYETANRAPDSLTAPTVDYVSDTVYNSRSDRIRRYQDVVGGGIESTWTWDTATRRLSRVRMVAAGGAAPVLVDQDLLYDSVGSILRVEDHANAGQFLCYEYDGLGQLGLAMSGVANCSAVSYATGVDGFRHVYTYEPSGNIDKVRRGSVWTYYDYTTAGRPHLVADLTGGTTGSFSYDSAGNTTTRTVSGTTQTLTYDESNRLTEVSEGATVTADFSYDAEGNRTRYQDQTGTYIDDAYEWREEGATVVESKNYWFDGDLVAVRQAGVLSYLASDGLGSVSGTYQPGPNTSQVRRYLPYGSERTAASLPTSFGYTGQREDNTTGLMFYRSRFYDPVVGRFSQPDTIVPDPGNSLDLNRFTYVRNNPINLSDPTGHCPVNVNAQACGSQDNAALEGGNDPGITEPADGIENQFSPGTVFSGEVCYGTLTCSGASYQDGMISEYHGGGLAIGVDFSLSKVSARPDEIETQVDIGVSYYLVGFELLFGKTTDGGLWGGVGVSAGFSVSVLSGMVVDDTRPGKLSDVFRQMLFEGAEQFIDSAFD